MTRALGVWWDGAIVGSFRLNRHGQAVFAYAKEWLTSPKPRPVSVSLPLRDKPYSHRASRPFFEGLLPEEGQRLAVAKALGISEHNEFRLLEALGGEVAGALTLWPEGRTPPDPIDAGSPPQLIGDGDLINILDSLPGRPLLAGNAVLRLSLAGAQSKLPVIATDQGIALPAPGAPTTHILKPPSERFPGITENEAFCMRLGTCAVGIHGCKSAPTRPFERSISSNMAGYSPQPPVQRDGGIGFSLSRLPTAQAPSP